MVGARALEIAPLTGIRGVAAVWVLLFHADRILSALEPGFALLRPLVQVGYLGVDLFFVLSGFVIAHNYVDRLETAGWTERLDFLRARLARLYPVHLATLAVIAGGVVAAAATGRSYGAPEQHRPEDLVLHLLLVHDWVWSSSPSWNLPSWSISAEWFAYLGFVLATPALARVRSATSAAVLALACYVGLTLALGATGPGSLDVTTQGGLVRVGFQFAAGCFLQRLYRASPEAPRLYGAVTVLATAGVAVLVLAKVGDGLIAPVLGLLVLGVARSHGMLPRLLSTPAAIRSGKLSYSLYMTHGIVLHLFEALVRPERLASAGAVTRWCVVGGLCVALWLAAEVTYRFVEEPGRRWLRQVPLGGRQLA